MSWLQAAPAHKEAVRGIAFSPSDLKFATGSDDSTIKASPLQACPSYLSCQHDMRFPLNVTSNIQFLKEV